jgi:hypothetical protein
MLPIGLVYYIIFKINFRKKTENDSSSGYDLSTDEGFEAWMDKQYSEWHHHNLPWASPKGRAILAVKMHAYYNMVFISFLIPFLVLISLVALSLGHFIVPIAYVPLTYQMIIANLCFDSLTIFTTIYIFSLVLSNFSFFNAFIAVFLDFVLSSFYSCVSIFLTLYNTPQAIRFAETLNLLFARSMDGRSYELGPLFWLMHSTFLPTLILLLVIALCCLMVLLHFPFEWVFERFDNVAKPVAYSAAFLLVIASFAGIIAALI